MPRLLGVDIPNDKKTVVSLTYLFGVGNQTSRDICHKAGLDEDKKARDLTDEEMMVRPIASCNHIKWQVGHLIASENKMINSCCPGAMPDLPAGFADRYASEHSASDDQTAFDSKGDLLAVENESVSQNLRDAFELMVGGDDKMS